MKKNDTYRSEHASVDLDTIRIFWNTGLANKGLLIASLVFPLSSIFLNTVLPFVVSKMLAGLASSSPDTMRYIPFFIAFAVIGVALNRFGFSAALRHQAKTMALLQTKALNVLIKRSIGFHNNHVGGKLVSDAIDFPSAYGQLAGSIYATLIPFAVTIVSGLIVVFFSSWALGIVLLIMVIYAVGSGIYESQRRKPLRDHRLAAVKSVTSHIADIIVNVQTVKTFANEQLEVNSHKKLNAKLAALRLKDWSTAAHQGSNRIAIFLVLQLALLVFAIQLTESNPNLLAASIFAFSFTILLSNRLFEINNMIRNIEEALLQASPMTETLLGEQEIKDVSKAASLKVDSGKIQLENVRFKYNDAASDQIVFSQLNLVISPGEKVGIVGPSGGGKSTLTRLLLRFEDVQSGSISIDDQDVKLVSQHSLRKHIGYVPQEPLLFHRTIKENIAYGLPDTDIDTIKKVAKLAHAAEFIETLPEDYLTIVGERGVKLSGGQRQRIAIARAMLKNAPILILDEATSALDSESEVLIQDALWKLMESKTAIVIAHRLSTIQKMDRIIVMDKGRIVEEGSHQELLKKKGLYARLWSHQSGGFLDE